MRSKKSAKCFTARRGRNGDQADGQVVRGEWDREQGRAMRMLQGLLKSIAVWVTTSTCASGDDWYERFQSVGLTVSQFPWKCVSGHLSISVWRSPQVDFNGAQPTPRRAHLPRSIQMQRPSLLGWGYGCMAFRKYRSWRSSCGVTFEIELHGHPRVMTRQKAIISRQRGVIVSFFLMLSLLTFFLSTRDLWIDSWTIT